MAVKNFNVHINLNKQELLNAKLQNLATAPSLTAADAGFVYWKKADVGFSGAAYVWTGLDWIELSSVYNHPTFSSGNIPTPEMTGAVVPSGFTIDNGHLTAVTTRTLTPTSIGAAAALHTHAFTDITGLPTNTILGNNTAGTGAAKALTVADLMNLMSIGYGNLALLVAGVDTGQKTWTAKDISDYVNSKIANYITVVNLALGVRTSTTLPITNSAGTGFVLPVATTTLAGLMSAADKLKLDGVAANANNYVHPTLNPGTHPFSTVLTSGLQVLSQMVVNNEGHVVTIKGRNLTAADLAAVMIDDSINNGTVSTWSSTKIYTEVQSAINQAQTGALQYKGDFNPSTNLPNISTDVTIKTGYTYVVTATGMFAGQEVEAGDMIISKVNSPLATAANWQIVNKNIPAIVAASTTLAGIVRLATNAEAITGTSSTIAVTPASLTAVLDVKLKAYIANFGDGSSTNFTITHGLNTTDVLIMIQVVSDKSFIECEVRAASSNTITVGVNIPPANNGYRVLIKPI